MNGGLFQGMLGLNRIHLLSQLKYGLYVNIFCTACTDRETKSDFPFHNYISLLISPRERKQHYMRLQDGVGGFAQEEVTGAAGVKCLLNSFDVSGEMERMYRCESHLNTIIIQTSLINTDEFNTHDLFIAHFLLQPFPSPNVEWII